MTRLVSERVPRQTVQSGMASSQPADTVRRPGICLITETYFPVVGGGETQARALAEGLVARRYGVLVVTRRSSRSFARREQAGDVSVIRLAPSGNGHYKKWGLLLSVPPTLLSLRANYDVIFVSGFRVVGLAAVLASRLLRKKCVLKADSLGEMSGRFFRAGLKRIGLKHTSPPFRAFLAFRNRVLRQADAFVSISSAITEELLRGGVAASRIHEIPNGVPIDRFSPADDFDKALLRKRMQISPEQRVVVYTGRLVSYKGLPLLLEVWREVASRAPNALLVIVGSGGTDIHNCESSLRTYVQAHGLEGSVRFTGAVANVHQYLQAADIFVFPTESEAFGISLVEAMSCGLPAISTRIGGIKDIISDGQNGILVDAGDGQQLGRALGLLLEDRAFADAIGRRARETAVSRYASESVVERYGQLFSNLVSTAEAVHTELEASNRS